MRYKLQIYQLVLVAIVIVVSCSFHFSFAQSTKVYFKFILDSKETYHKGNGLQTTESDLLYQKQELGNRNMVFLIKGLMFIHNPSKMEKKMVNRKRAFLLSNLLSPDETEQYIQDLQKKYPFGYKHLTGSHPKMFVAVVNGNKDITFYEVRWQYYIE